MQWLADFQCYPPLTLHHSLPSSSRNYHATATWVWAVKILLRVKACFKANDRHNWWKESSLAELRVTLA
ncbi:hypothetical protein J6590_092938 [Homalodisca vitripennis]|nr:hypothetical protein J6590_092938 [Homalodisca vitripennis]